ncbi:MAG: formate dehydrogenase accessory sulfurtransferase FdhD [Ferruginibacter sp.]
MKDNRVEHINIQKISDSGSFETEDKVAVEEPLEISVEYSTANGRMIKNIAVTMRTPGNDEELAAGFLFTEAVIKNVSELREIKQSPVDENRLQVSLQENIIPALGNTVRNFYSTSSCGICGKASIDAIRTITQYAGEKDSMTVHANSIYSLQDELKKRQQVFEDTGGIHASALFDSNCNFKKLREDVGRHNALDKIIGSAFLKNELPLNNSILLLSGRASFELVQKAAVAGIKIIAAVGAPSSLAVELAKECNITLIGFLRNDRFNIYCGKQRIISL